MNMQPLVIEDALRTVRFEAERDLVGTMLACQDAISANLVEPIVTYEDFSDHTMGRLYMLYLNGVKQGLHGHMLVKWIIVELTPDALGLAHIGLTPSSLIALCVANAGPRISLEAAARQIRVHRLEADLANAVGAGMSEQAQGLAAEVTRLKSANLEQCGGPERLADVTERVLNSINSAYQQGHAPRDYAPTGLASLGRLIGGWRRKKLYVIAGRPGMGKSTFALSALLHAAHKGHGVMMFSLEMGKEELSEMALANLAYNRHRRIEYRDISPYAVARDGFEAKFTAVMDVAPIFNSLPLYIDDKQGLSMAEIRSKAQQFGQRLEADGKHLDVICVDHLGLVKASNNYRGNKVMETEEVSADLKRLAKELDCAVLALAQLSRQVEGRDDKRPNLSDLRWSGAIEQDADVILFPYRPEYYLRRPETDQTDELERQDKLAKVKSRLELLVEKHRGGPTGQADLFCDVGCAVVSDLEAVS